MKIMKLKITVTKNEKKKVYQWGSRVHLKWQKEKSANLKFDYAIEKIEKKE